ncbi:hypothetical protein TNCV_1854701 [Trichonephila clavipes]|nr:hypothetical protein TNCV_1854701 [Trichonephila clavipes]
MTVRFDSIPLQYFEEEYPGWSEASNLSSPSTNLTSGLAARQLFRVPLRKGTLHLQTFMYSPGLEPRPYGTAVSVTNHYTGWVVKF